MSFTVTLYLLAIAYNVSPFFTMYIFSSVITGCSFIFKTCPILSVLLVKLFNDFNSFTVILNLLAMLHNVSPLFTV